MKPREPGLPCSRCGMRPAIPGHVQCQECLDRGNRASRRRAEALKAAGTCSRCGRNAPEPGRKTCRECTEQESARKKALVRERREAGLCTKCGKNPAAPGRLRCASCIAKLRAYWSHSGACDGDCDRCGFPDCVSKGPMLDRYRARRKAIRDERVLKGLCTQCGKPAAPGGRMCPACRERAREQERARRKERK